MIVFISKHEIALFKNERRKNMACNHSIPIPLVSLSTREIRERRECNGGCFFGVCGATEPCTSLEELIEFRVTNKTMSEVWYCRCGYTNVDQVSVLSHKTRCPEWRVSNLYLADPTNACICGLNLTRKLVSKLGKNTQTCLAMCPRCKSFGA